MLPRGTLNFFQLIHRVSLEFSPRSHLARSGRIKFRMLKFSSSKYILNFNKLQQPRHANLSRLVNRLLLRTGLKKKLRTFYGCTALLYEREKRKTPGKLDSLFSFSSLSQRLLSRSRYSSRRKMHFLPYCELVSVNCFSDLQVMKHYESLFKSTRVSNRIKSRHSTRFTVMTRAIL